MHVPQQPCGSHQLARLCASQHGDGMSICDQRRYQVASDEAGPPGDDDPHHHHQFNVKRSVLLEGSFLIPFLSSDTKILSSIHDFETKSNPWGMCKQKNTSCLMEMRR